MFEDPRIQHIRLPCSFCLAPAQTLSGSNPFGFQTDVARRGPHLDQLRSRQFLAESEAGPDRASAQPVQRAEHFPSVLFAEHHALAKIVREPWIALNEEPIYDSAIPLRTLPRGGPGAIRLGRTSVPVCTEHNAFSGGKGLGMCKDRATVAEVTLASGSRFRIIETGAGLPRRTATPCGALSPR